MASPPPRKSVAMEPRAIAAPRLATGQFPQIHSHEDRKAVVDAGAYPCARFIRGRFHAAVFADETTVLNHTD